MNRVINRLWQEDDGVLSFEWVLLITLVVIGIVGGVAAARDAIIDELGDIAEALVNFDQSYVIAGFTVDPDGVPNSGDEIVFPDQEFEDDAGVYVDCNRGGPAGQVATDDADDGG